MSLNLHFKKHPSLFNEFFSFYSQNSLALTSFDEKISSICRIYQVANHLYFQKKIETETLNQWNKDWIILKDESFLLVDVYNSIVQDSQKLLTLNETIIELPEYYQQIDDKLGQISREQTRFSTILKSRITKQMGVLRKLAKASDALWNDRELTREEELNLFRSHLENVRMATVLKKEYSKVVETLTNFHEELSQLKIALPSSSFLHKLVNLGKKVLGRKSEKEARDEKLIETKKSLQKRLDHIKRSVSQDLTFFKGGCHEISKLFDAENVEEMESLQILNILDRDPDGISFQKEMYQELDAAQKALHDNSLDDELLKEYERTFSLVFYLEDFLQDKEESEWEMWKSRLEPLRNDVIGFLKRASSTLSFSNSSTSEILEQMTLNSWESLPLHQELILERSELEQREIFSEIERGAAEFQALTSHPIKIELSKKQIYKQVWADFFLQFISWSSHVHWNREIHQKILKKGAYGDKISFEKGSLEEMMHRMEAKQSFARAISGWERICGGVEEIQRGSQTFVQALIKKEKNRHHKESSQESSIDSSLISLKKDTDLFHSQLVKSVTTSSTIECGLDPFNNWIEQVKGLCFDLTLIESQIAVKMEKARSVINRKIPGDKEWSDYGRKHKHLMMQSQLLEVLKIPGVTIPVPHGISNTKLTNFIRKFVPEVFKHWQELKVLFKSYSDSQPFLDTLEATHLLKTINEQLITAFSKPQVELFDPEWISWIKSIEEAGEYLMVRSTGAEDSRQMANAGGNLSKAYVLPEIGAITQAIGAVIASYFSRNSLQNRINAGFNPFEEEMTLAVTTQRLIGEPIGGASHPSDIPVSLVIFTNEPLYVGSEKFRVMRISATYGHGEGVVGNLGIGSDTVLILQSALYPDRIYILYDNQPKEERLAPTASSMGTKLSKLTNPKEIVHERALSDQMLARLVNWGIIAEKYFDNFPTDIEIVIKGDTIYPVQARPVNRPVLLPTYFDSSKAMTFTPSPLIQTINGNTIVSGVASVILISEESQILFAETLEEAERHYRKDFHRIVITSRTEPANSHPVVNFSSLGVPCLHIKDIEQAKGLAKKISPEWLLLTCIQSGSLTLWDSSKADANLFIEKGFTVHPAKISFSLPLRMAFPFKNGAPANQELENLVLRLRSAPTKQAAEAVLFQLGEQVLLVKRQVHTLSTKLKTMPHTISIATHYLKILEAISEHAEQALDEMRTILGRGRLEKLFHAKVIETTFVPSDGSLYQFTIEEASSLIENTEQLIAYQQVLPHAAYFAQEFILGMQEAPFNELAQNWQHFLLELELEVHQGRISSSEAIKFKELTEMIYQSGTFPSWLLMIASPQITKNPSVIAFRHLLESFSSEDQIILKEVKIEQQKLKNLRRQISALSSHESYSTLYQNLLETSLFYLDQEGSSRSLANKMKKSSTTRMILAQLMNEFVDIFDTVIKKVKIESNFSDRVKVQKIKELLISYFDLLRDWSTNIVSPLKIPFHSEWPLENYLNKEENLLKSRSHQTFQLRPSNEFSVAAAKLGSQTVFDRHFPETLEDDFTLIHQNLLVCLASITNELLPSELDTGWPSALSLAMGEIQKSVIPISSFAKTKIQPNLIGVEITKEKIIMSFNIALNNHSSRLILTYSLKNKKMTLEASFMGLARDRWKGLASVITLLDKYHFLPLDGPLKQTEQDLHARWKVDGSNLNLALLYYKNSAEITLYWPAYLGDYLGYLDKLFRSSPFALQWNKIFLEQEELFESYSKPYDRMSLLFIEKEFSFSSLKELAKVLFWSETNPGTHDLILKMQSMIFEYPKQKMINPSIRIDDFVSERLSTSDQQIIVSGLLKKYFGDSLITILPAFIETFEIYLKNPDNTIEGTKKEWLTEWMDVLLKDPTTSSTVTSMIQILLTTSSGATFIVNYAENRLDSHKREFNKKIRESLPSLNNHKLLKVLINLSKNQFLLEEIETLLIKKYQKWSVEDSSELIRELIKAGYKKGVKEATTFYFEKVSRYSSFISKTEARALQRIYLELISRGESIEEAFLFVRTMLEFCANTFPYTYSTINSKSFYECEPYVSRTMIETLIKHDSKMILSLIERLNTLEGNWVSFYLYEGLIRANKISVSMATTFIDLIMTDIEQPNDSSWYIFDQLFLDGFDFLKRNTDEVFASGHVEKAVRRYLLFAKRAESNREYYRFLEHGSITARSYESLINMGQVPLVERIAESYLKGERRWALFNFLLEKGHSFERVKKLAQELFKDGQIEKSAQGYICLIQNNYKLDIEKIIIEFSKIESNDVILIIDALIKKKYDLDKIRILARQLLLEKKMPIVEKIYRALIEERGIEAKEAVELVVSFIIRDYKKEINFGEILFSLYNTFNDAAIIQVFQGILFNDYDWPERIFHDFKDKISHMYYVQVVYDLIDQLKLLDDRFTT